MRGTFHGSRIGVRGWSGFGRYVFFSSVDCGFEARVRIGKGEGSGVLSPCCCRGLGFRVKKGWIKGRREGEDDDE